jgi:hypothetical protein
MYCFTAKYKYLLCIPLLVSLFLVPVISVGQFPAIRSLAVKAISRGEQQGKLRAPGVPMVPELC